MIGISQRIALICVFSLSLSQVIAGGYEKGMEAMSVKDYFEANKQFSKIVFREPVLGNFGLAQLHRQDNNPYFNLNKALYHCDLADSSLYVALPKQRQKCLDAGVDNLKIKELKQEIASAAFQQLMLDATDENLRKYLSQYGFAEEAKEVRQIRDRRAFDKARRIDTYEGYKEFILNHPVAQERVLADSLYALRFFEVKTADSSLDAYIAFVEEFPASPYAKIAYDTIYANVLREGHLSSYMNFVSRFPMTQHGEDAWMSINALCLKSYDRKAVESLVDEMEKNPFQDLLVKEYELILAPRFVMEDSLGMKVLDAQGKQHGEYYEKIGEFKEGRAIVFQQGKLGFINKEGQPISKLEFDEAYDFHQGLAIVEKGGRFGAIDRFGRIRIPFLYEELGNFISGYSAYELEGRTGFLNWNGLEKLGEFYSRVSDFKDGYAIVSSVEGTGVIDSTGTLIVPMQYEQADYPISGLIPVTQNGLQGMYGLDGEMKIPAQFQKLGEPSNHLIAFISDEDYGYLSYGGEVRVQGDFELSSTSLSQHGFQRSIAAALSDGKWGLIDVHGNWLISPEYDQLLNDGGRFLRFSDAGRWGLIDRDGVIGAEGYAQIDAPNAGLSRAVDKNGEVLMLGISAKPLFENRYQDLRSLEESEFLLYQSEKLWGLIDREGQVLIPAEYEQIEQLNIRYLKLSISESEQLYDLETQQFLEF